MSFRTLLCYPNSDAVTVMPPLGIGYLASAAEKAGFSTDVLDLSRRHIRLDGLDGFLKNGDYDVVGVSISTPNYYNAQTLIKKVRQSLPSSTIVVGGAHPTSFLKQSLEELGVDYLVQKESETTFPKFLECLKTEQDPVGRIPGTFALRDGVLAGKPNEEFIEDLDSIPWPAWEKLEPHKYPCMPHQFFVKRIPVAPVLTTRGCPMDCTFCASGYLFGRTIRTRSPEDVVLEMKYLKERFGIREIHFEDDNMTLARQHALDLFDEIIQADLDLPFKFPNGLMTMTLDEEILGKMAKAGCYQISLGIETTSEQSLDKEKKLLPYEDVKAVVKLAKSHRIDVQGLFVVGLPYEEEDRVRQTVRDAIRLDLDLAHFGVFVPLPGSLHGEKLAGCDIGSVNFFTPHQSYSSIDKKKLKALQRFAILRFYLRPRPIWKLLSMLRLRQLVGCMNIIRKYILGI